MPPFRLFLLASLAFFFALFAFQIGDDFLTDTLNIDTDIETVIEQTDLDAADKARALEQIEAAKSTRLDWPDDLNELEARVKYVTGSPVLFNAMLEKWAPRISLLIVPLTMISLILLHIFNRRAYVFHHLIFALHLHAWFYVFGLIIMASAGYLGGWGWTIFPTLAFAYTWRSLSIVYDSGKWMSLLRTIVLLIIWLVACVALFSGTIVLSALGV